jgi:hypothetical protein
MRKELTLTELDTQIADLLPERETLTWGNNNWAGIYASNSSLALNAVTYGSVAQSSATQTINVAQG